MRTLHLILKGQWFKMVESGEKKEEYRDISKHWIKRLCNTNNILDGFKEFDAIIFQHGYGTNAPRVTVALDKIDVGYGRGEWGAELGKEYFVIKLGDIIVENKIIKNGNTN